MGAFQDSPQRSNGNKVDSSWWNTLRAAGILLEEAVAALSGGGGSTTEVFVAIANNQAAPTTTAFAASSAYRVTRLKYWLRRVATDTVMEAGDLIILYDGTTFQIGRSGVVETLIETGVAFTINSVSGEVSYTSSNMAGTYNVGQSKMGYLVTTQGTI